MRFRHVRILISCNCYLTQEFDSDYFKNYTPSPELLQQVRDDPRFPEFKSWAMGWLEKTGAGFVAPIVAPAIVPEAVMPEWKAAETIEEADQWAKENLNIRNINHGITNVDTLNIVYKQLDDLKREGYDLHYRNINSTGGFVFGKSSTFELYLNKSYFNKEDIFIKKIKICVNTEFHPEGCDTIKSVISHEFAHSLTLSQLDAKMGGFYDKIKVLKREYNSEIKKLQKQFHVTSDYGNGKVYFDSETMVSGKNLNTLTSDYLQGKKKVFISDYANKNINEWTAEAFTMYKHSPNPSSFSMRVGSLIDEYFKKTGDIWGGTIVGK